MTKKQVRERLLRYITERQGAKGTELIADLFNRALNNKEIKSIADANIPEMLETLVAEGRIVEVEYRLPLMAWRVKSFYLPKNTEVRLFS